MPNIVVVDDDLTNLQLLQMLLELDGFTVIACTTIDQAISAANKVTDAFVIDWHLERNAIGLELLKAVRQGQTEAHSNTIIIISSGDQRREEEAMAAGADHFLLKPYAPDELLQLVIGLLPGGVVSDR